MPITSPDGLRAMLDYQTIAVVGCSATPGKAAHEIPAYMQRHGYRVVPVNPFHDEVLGEKAYDSLADVDEAVDLVNVFRPSAEAGAVVDAAIDRAADHGDVKAVWLQLGIRDDEAAARAEEAGLDYVQDKCYKVEHARFVA
ncbi:MULTISPECIES: CoA-binding protein [Haloferax]|uniref:CoA-binding protein n=1 Tax=Haloferax marinum TaxID=2666143 RepID=A0A6A8G5D6_9EURY|nr:MULTISPECIES: CoA-binding protein [Haloferax]KAB1196344.1 CoA-binding protein [Haloferax sp. CBA1150]MRW95336.1 CoA-binding protein [Haloferax marinum]